MSDKNAELPVQKTEHAEQQQFTTSASNKISDSVNLSSSRSNSAASEMMKGSLNESQKLLNTWNNFSLEGDDKGASKGGGSGKGTHPAGDSARTSKNLAVDNGNYAFGGGGPEGPSSSAKTAERNNAAQLNGADQLKMPKTDGVSEALNNVGSSSKLPAEKAENVQANTAAAANAQRAEQPRQQQANQQQMFDRQGLLQRIRERRQSR